MARSDPVGGWGGGGSQGGRGGPAADEGRLHCGGSISPTQQRLQSISRQGLQPLDGLVFCHWEGGLAGTFLGHPPPAQLHPPTQSPGAKMAGTSHSRGMSQPAQVLRGHSFTCQSHVASRRRCQGQIQTGSQQVASGKPGHMPHTQGPPVHGQGQGISHPQRVPGGTGSCALQDKGPAAASQGVPPARRPCGKANPPGTPFSRPQRRGPG